jgi:hypothetical protein
MRSNRDVLGEALIKEQTSEVLAKINHRTIDGIMSKYGFIDTELHDLVIDIKILRMKKIMAKYKTFFLTPEQAKEIWS